MCKGNNSIPSIIQNLWDNELKDKNVMIILCGSAMSFIEKDLLAEKNPLYGRATGIYKMMPMDFYDSKKFFPDYSEEDQILAYSILGGIPHYLKQFDSNLTIEENIKKNILSKGCVLYSEVEFMLNQELRETATYNAIIEAVALGNTKLNDISQKALISDTAKTNIYLKNLIELGLISREFSVDTRIKERANSNKGMYKLTDNFFRFWYSFMFSNISQIEDGDVDGVYEYIIKPSLNNYASRTFEDVCLEYVKKLQKDNALPFRYSQIGRWRGKTSIREKGEQKKTRVVETEIDILGVDYESTKYLVGECKFKNNPFSYSEYLDMISKLEKEKEAAEFYYLLFSKSGFDEKIVSEAKNSSNIFLYDLKDIVNYS